MALIPQTIGLNMSHGFAGSYARQPDMIVNTAPLGGTATIPFGTPLVRGEDGAVIPMGTGNTGGQFIGVAGREVKSPAEFFSQSVGQYAPQEAVSVFQRGCINVKCQKGSPAIDGTVYVRRSGQRPMGRPGGQQRRGRAAHCLRWTCDRCLRLRRRGWRLLPALRQRGRGADLDGQQGRNARRGKRQYHGPAGAKRRPRRDRSARPGWRRWRARSPGTPGRAGAGRAPRSGGT